MRDFGAHSLIHELSKDEFAEDAFHREKELQSTLIPGVGPLLCPAC